MELYLVKPLLAQIAWRQSTMRDGRRDRTAGRFLWQCAALRTILRLFQPAVGCFQHLFYGVLIEIASVDTVAGHHLGEKLVDLFGLQRLGAGGPRLQHGHDAGGGNRDDEDGGRGDGEPAAAYELAEAVESRLRPGLDRTASIGRA